MISRVNDIRSSHARDTERARPKPREPGRSSSVQSSSEMQAVVASLSTRPGRDEEGPRERETEIGRPVGVSAVGHTRLEEEDIKLSR